MNKEEIKLQVLDAIALEPKDISGKRLYKDWDEAKHFASFVNYRKIERTAELAIKAVCLRTMKEIDEMVLDGWADNADTLYELKKRLEEKLAEKDQPLLDNDKLIEKIKDKDKQIEIQRLEIHNYKNMVEFKDKQIAELNSFLYFWYNKYPKEYTIEVRKRNKEPEKKEVK
jgi:hypothetical protein